MVKKIFVSILLFINISAFSEFYKERLNEMVGIVENTYGEILDFISNVDNEKTQEKLVHYLKSSKGYFKFFLMKTKELTSEIEDKEEMYAEKIRLSSAFAKLLDNRFDKIEGKIKKVKTLHHYRLRWFERALYAYLKLKLKVYNYYTAYKTDDTSNADNYYKQFEKVLADLLSFIYKNKELYKENSVFIKKVFLTETKGGYASREAKILGDLDLLIEFLKGKFSDTKGLRVQYASFKKSRSGRQRTQDIVLLMKYQPVSADVEIKDIREVDVVVTGDNLEDILTFTLNQGSRIVNMQVGAEKKVVKLSTENMKYKEFIEENIVSSKIVVTKAILKYKKEVKPKKKKKRNKRKILEVGLRLTIGKL